MMELDRALGYAALCCCAWQLAAAFAAGSARGGHRLPPVPKSLSSGAGHMDVTRRFFVTSHGLALYVRKWLPRFDCAPRGLVFLLHGLGEHGGRYDHVARQLAKQGFAVFAVDHQGHGMSDGERMYAGKLLHLTEDYMEFVRHVLHGPGAEGNKNANVIDGELEAHADVAWSDLPRFLLGHSMGGIMTLQLVELSQQQSLSWNGAIVCSPPLWGVPGGGCSFFLRFLAWLLPRSHLPGFEFEKLGDNCEEYNRWARDSLLPNHGSTLQLMCSLLCEGERLSLPDSELAKTFTVPLYMLHGELDTLAYPQGSVNFYTACTQKDKTLRLVPKAVHEVLNLEGNEKVVQELVDWMEAQIK
ncbi:hypothetical protein BBJ28_00007831 [Nothophytophthora sp. Chile5]|nr:hypothetical protein BBJ28_00007831 [Nothophytophthora sp. Chile5]